MVNNIERDYMKRLKNTYFNSWSTPGFATTVFVEIKSTDPTKSAKIRTIFSGPFYFPDIVITITGNLFNVEMS